MVRIVGNRGAALEQLQTIIENRALTCVENVVRLELVIVSCSVIVRQSVWELYAWLPEGGGGKSETVTGRCGPVNRLS